MANAPCTSPALDRSRPSIGLYIHIPWCIQKCPYCDFNSHTLKANSPTSAYIDRLIQDVATQADQLNPGPIGTIFIGGGTPSLISPKEYARLFQALDAHLTINTEAEITLEANPGASEQAHFQAYRALGINRLSIGVQSLDDQQLKTLGRIHCAQEARQAVKAAQAAQFKRINIDMMYGLPNQSLEAGLQDLEDAIALETEHLSWYQLTLEPHTPFYHNPPTLPAEPTLITLQEAGMAKLNAHGFCQYEISAYARESAFCQHNLNYWQFGDYLGIGAGAHGKMSCPKTQRITRYAHPKHPKAYIALPPDHLPEATEIPKDERALEYMMNTLRLNQPIPFAHFEKHTFLNRNCLKAPLKEAGALGLITTTADTMTLTAKGNALLNEVLLLF